MTSDELQQFVIRYVGQWNEPNDDTRREMVRDVWAENASDFTSANVYRGHDEIEDRVTQANKKYVQERHCLFRLRGTPSVLHNAIRLSWDMLEAGAVTAAGLDFLILDETGRIRTAYQFLEPQQLL